MKALQRRRGMRSEALLGLAEFAFLVRGDGGGSFLAVGDVIARNLQKQRAEKTKMRRRTSGRAGRRQKRSHAESNQRWLMSCRTISAPTPGSISRLVFGPRRRGEEKSLWCKCTNVAKDKAIKTEGKRDLRLEERRTSRVSYRFFSRRHRPLETGRTTLLHAAVVKNRRNMNLEIDFFSFFWWLHLYVLHKVFRHHSM